MPADNAPSAMDALLEYHRAFGLVASEHPTLDVPPELRELRCALIEEEAAEFRAAIEAGDLIGVADAIGDLLYAVYGAAVTSGSPLRRSSAKSTART